VDERSLAVVLAAGKGTRMRSKTPKVMHPVGGRPMLGHVLAAVREAGIADVALVVGEGADWAPAAAPDAGLYVQATPLGTAHAVLAAESAFRPAHEAVVVLYGDTPLVRPATIRTMVERILGGADIVVLAFEAEDPTGYGRVLLDANRRVVAIREEREANEEERQVRLANSGLMAIRAGAPTRALRDIAVRGGTGEYYLTDIVAIGAERGFVMVWMMAEAAEVMGVNDRVQLAAAEAEFQRRARADAMERATLVAPPTVFFSHDTRLGEDVVVEPNVVFGPGVTVGDRARIRAFSHLEGASVAAGAVVGPYARLRPGATIGKGAHVGNFVEVKNASLGEGAKANHLAYIGDATVGADANIGAGTITCNYDGTAKHRTEIGAGAFIGSNSALVAPVTIGERAYVGSGSVITEDVPADALAIGRGRQVVKEGRSPARPAAEEGG
jgi:bifunctional UDP-N-acetylglucosamine pyrophosphorylase/glucosamine-1-phosphate N-acetyltransferase